jgi:hypothetical protein
MCSQMLTVHLESTGTSLVQRDCSEIAPPIHERHQAGFNLLHTNWILVNDIKGNSRAQMQWVVDR